MEKFHRCVLHPPWPTERESDIGQVRVVLLSQSVAVNHETERGADLR